MRNAFINTLISLAQGNRHIYLLTADAGFTILEKFYQTFPDRYLNVGIAEATMIGVSAGLALSGKQVFCYTIVPFVTMRCFEQIRIDLCYQNLPVKLAGVGEGVTYGTAGATHHAIEDIAVMRALPNMAVICPGDPFEMESAVGAALAWPGPCYIRMGKSGEPRIHRSSLKAFRIGKGIEIERGSELALISTGNMLPAAGQVRDLLKREGLRPELVSMHTVKPLDRDLLRDLSARCRIIATLEEHSVIGGLGSAVGDAILEDRLGVRLIKFAVPDAYADQAGSQEYLRRRFGLSVEQIVSRLQRELAA